MAEQLQIRKGDLIVSTIGRTEQFLVLQTGLPPYKGSLGRQDTLKARDLVTGIEDLFPLSFFWVNWEVVRED